jgi:hypothetical protein
MGKRFSRAVEATGVVAAVFSCALLAPAFRFSPKAGLWWNVSLGLEVCGDYAFKGSGVSRAGDFSYEAVWTGTMEGDGTDFILYHVETRTLAWKIREGPDPAKGSPILTEKETAARPVLKLNYILRKGNRLDVDFVVEPIPIPLVQSAEKFPLFLPCSGEHVRDRSDLFYNDFVSGGSNFVRIPLEALSASTFEKRFRWDWGSRGGVLGEDESAFISNRHSVEVTVCLVSHEGFRPGGGSGRRRGGAGPG